MKVNITSVSYRLIDEERNILKEYSSYSQDIYWDALRHAGEFKASVTIERVVRWEYDDKKTLFDGDKRQMVTGEYTVDIPANLEDELHRYNSVNGWLIL